MKKKKYNRLAAFNFQQKLKESLAWMLILTILIQLQLFTPMVANAADADKYIKHKVDTEYHMNDGYEEMFQNVCDKKDMSPSITYVNSKGKKVSVKKGSDGTVYAPKGTKVKLSWSAELNSGFAAKKVYFWQPSDGFGAVTKYNHAGGGNDLYSLRGKASGVIGDIVSESSGKFTITYTIDEYKEIKYLCESPQLPGNSDGSPAVGNCESNVNLFYYYADKVDIVEDNTPPTVTLAVNGTPTNNWYPLNTTVTITAEDKEGDVKTLTVNGAPRSNPYTFTLASGVNNITYSAEDVAGNSTGDKSATVNVDGTAPTISATPSQKDTNGWYKGDTSVTFNVSDSESGVASFKVNNEGKSNGYKVSVPEGTTSYKYEASDNAGNTNSKTISLSVDKSSPTVSIAGGASFFTNKDVSLSITGTDKYSGLKRMEVEYSSDNAKWTKYQEFTFEGVTSPQTKTVLASKNGYYRVKAEDLVGYSKTSDQTIHITKIDKEAPTIVATVKGNEGPPVDKWYRGSATITITATDEGVSGLKELEYNGLLTTNSIVQLQTQKEGVNNYRYKATDHAGNSSATGNTEVYVDASAPIDLSWSNNQDSWTNKDITVTMSARDLLSGMSKFIVQRKNEETGEWKDYTQVSASYETTLVTKQAAIKENGTYRFKAVDRVGYETISGNEFVINKIDKEKPVITPEEIGDKSSNGWFKDKMTLKLLVKEYGVSGLKNLYLKMGGIKTNKEFDSAEVFQYIHKELIDDEGVTTVDYNALDCAGNYSDDGQSIIKIDSTTPIDVTASADTQKWTNSSVTLTAGATDKMSGLAKLVVQKYESGSWSDYLTTNFNGENTRQTYDFPIEENGYYRVKAVDMVGYEMTSDKSQGGSEVVDPTNPLDPTDPKKPFPGIIIIDIIDKIKPIVSAEIIGGESYKLHSGGWYKEDVRLKVTATDEASGVGTLTCNNDISVNEEKSKIYVKEYAPFKTGINTFEYFATDVAGNDSEVGITDIKVDMIKPAIARITKLTNDWVNSETGVIFECEGQDEESGLLQFVLERSENGTDGWIDGTTYSFLGENTLEKVNMVVKQNGYYRLAVYDRVKNITYSSGLIYVDNIDDNPPDGNSLGITPNTEEWVNEETGVNLTATGQDTESGINQITIWEADENNYYHEVHIQDFTGDVELLFTDYLTHLNGYYKASAEDSVGNIRTMKDEESLEVPNIDPVNPTLVVNVDTEQWASQENGYEIYAYAKDSESGLNSIKLQRLEKNGEWKDTGIDFEKLAYVKDEEKLNTYEGNFIQNFANKLRFAVNKQFFSKTTNVANDKVVSGSNEMVKVLFRARENGTYRVVTDDIVENSTSSNAIVVTTMDFDSPTLMVEGNPTDWTNQTVTIKVTAKDDTSAISKMLLNGKEVKFKTVGKASFFTFDVEKNATFNVAAIDAAGHEVFEVVDVTKIDKDIPLVNSELGEWINGKAKAKVTLSDELSGIKSAYINETMIQIQDKHNTTLDTSINAEVTYKVTVSDYAGNKVTTTISENKALSYIKVTTPPDKKSYYAKENFEKKGMVVTAYYTDKSQQVVTNYEILDGKNLAVNQAKINVSYTEKGITKKTNTGIKVSTQSTRPDVPDPMPSVPDSPTPDTPTPNKPKPTPTKPITPTPTPVITTEETVEETLEEEVTKEPQTVESVTQEAEQVTKESNQFPMMAVVVGVAGVGMFLIFLFFILTNVKVYTMRENGKYKLIGRTRAKKQDEFYFVETNKIMIMNASSEDFKFVFSKGFVKTHSDINVAIKIENREFNRFLAKGEDTLYIKYDI